MDSKNLLIIFLLIFDTTTTMSNNDKNFEWDLYDLFSHGILKTIGDHLKENDVGDYKTCGRDILTWLTSLPQVWALEMLDANGKLPPGILGGHFHSLGSFDQCLAVYGKTKESVIKGKYCFAKLPLPLSLVQSLSESKKIIFPDVNVRVNNLDEFDRFSFNWGVCIPDSCKASEIQNMIRDVLKTLNVNITSKPIITVPEKNCSTNEGEETTGGFVAAITVICIFALMMLLSSIYEYHTRESKNDSRIHTALTAFSVITNSRKLFSVSKNQSNLKCLNGIRVISLFWVLIGHRYNMYVAFPTLSYFKFVEWVKTWHSSIVVAGNVSVDTFFVLSGFLLAFTFFSRIGNKKTFNIPLFYIHRFFRLWPAMAMAVFITGNVYLYMSSGPYWPDVGHGLGDPCVKNWWAALIYLQNYLYPVQQCVGQLWFVCVDMQLYILSPILLYPLLIKPKLGIANMIFWIIAAQITVAVVVYTHNWGAAPTDFSNIVEHSIKYYYPMHTRAITWLWGFAAGYITFRNAHLLNNPPKLNMFVVLLYWVVTLAIMCSIIFGLTGLQPFDHEINKAQDGTFNAFARSAWAISVIMVTFACNFGYGGPINWLLSLDIWEILGKFTYSQYLVHLAIQYMQRGSLRTSDEYSHFQTVYLFFGDIVITMVVSYFWILAFESPFIALEKAFFPPKKSIQNVKPTMVEN